MDVIDISRELLSAPVYLGSVPAALDRTLSIRDGSEYNYTRLTSGMHIGTHCDAPLHYLDGAADVAQTPLERYVGEAFVLTLPKNETVEPSFFEEHLSQSAKRVLMRSEGTSALTPDAARYLAGRGMLTVGTDALSVGTQETEMAVHVPLLEAGIGIVENLDLSKVCDGWYILCAAPLKVRGAEGSPCRAFLIRQEEAHD